LVESDDAVRAGRDAIAAAVANVLLDEHGVELGTDDGVRRTDLEAAGLLAVLADVGHHQPRLTAGDRRRGRHEALVVRRDLLDELDVSPVLRVELAGVVEAVAELGRISLELVPLLARDLAGFAADTNARVREEPDRSRVDRGHV